MKVNEHFPAIQGEGLTTGLPVYFLRLSGCNSACPWCDSKYHTEFTNMSIEEVSKILDDSGLDDIIITGGEPMLQKDALFNLMEQAPNLNYHLETNGTIYDFKMGRFDTIACSPKRFINDNEDVSVRLSRLKNLTYKFVYEPKEAKWWEDYVKKYNIDKKNVYIMPLGATREEQLENMPEVINYCITNKYKFSARIQVLAFDTKRGV